MDATPQPAVSPRFWWLTRGGGAMALLLIGVAVAHLALGRWAKNRIEAERAAWVAAGNPDPRGAITANPPPLVGDDNAAVLLEAALKLLPPLTPTQIDDWDTADWALPLTDRSEAALRSIVEQDQPTFVTLADARRLPRIDFGYQSLTISGLLPRLNEERGLANHLSFALRLAAHDGDVAAALDRAADIAWLGKAMVRDGEAPVTSLVSTGIESVAVNRVSENLLLQNPGDLTDEAQRAAWRRAAPNARRLIALLLDAGYDRDLRVLGFRGEFPGVYSFHNEAAGPGAAAYNFATAPFIDADVARLLDRQVRRMAAVEKAGDYYAFRTTVSFPTVGPEPQSLARSTTSLATATLEANTGRAGFVFFRVAVERRATATLLALKLYEADHAGALPATLDALVPAYLPFVPVDPMSPEGAPLQFKTDAPVPTVWSVGENAAKGQPTPYGFGREYPLRAPPAGQPRVLDFGGGDSSE